MMKQHVHPGNEHHKNYRVGAMSLKKPPPGSGKFNKKPAPSLQKPGRLKQDGCLYPSLQNLKEGNTTDTDDTKSLSDSSSSFVLAKRGLVGEKIVPTRPSVGSTDHVVSPTDSRRQEETEHSCVTTVASGGGGSKVPYQEEGSLSILDDGSFLQMADHEGRKNGGGSNQVSSGSISMLDDGSFSRPPRNNHHHHQAQSEDGSISLLGEGSAKEMPYGPRDEYHYDDRGGRKSYHMSFIDGRGGPGGRGGVGRYPSDDRRSRESYHLSYSNGFSRGGGGGGGSRYYDGPEMGRPPRPHDRREDAYSSRRPPYPPEDDDRSMARSECLHYGEYGRRRVSTEVDHYPMVREEERFHHPTGHRSMSHFGPPSTRGAYHGGNRSRRGGGHYEDRYRDDPRDHHGGRPRHGRRASDMYDVMYTRRNVGPSGLDPHHVRRVSSDSSYGHESSRNRPYRRYKSNPEGIDDYGRRYDRRHGEETFRERLESHEDRSVVGDRSVIGNRSQFSDDRSYQSREKKTDRPKDPSEGAMPGAFAVIGGLQNLKVDDMKVASLKCDAKAGLKKPPPPQTGSKEEEEVFLEVAPGVKEKLRRSEETKKAIESDFYDSAACWGCCASPLFCIADVSFFVCPECKCISPLESSGSDQRKNIRRHGVGLACTRDTLVKVQEEIAQAREGQASRRWRR